MISRLDRILGQFPNDSLERQHGALQSQIDDLERALAHPDRSPRQREIDEDVHGELTRVQREIGLRIMGQMRLPTLEGGLDYGTTTR